MLSEPGTIEPLPDVITAGGNHSVMTPCRNRTLTLTVVSPAVAAASLVALFFMHLKFEGKLIYVIFCVPLVLCVLLICALIPDVLHGPLFNVFFHNPQPHS